MPSTSWSGTLQIGLLNIPVKLQNMVKSKAAEKISFRQLNPNTNNPITTVRVDSETGDEVHSIRKGVSLDNDQVVPLDSTQVQQLEKMFGSRIEVEQFVDLKAVSSIDPVYIDRHYIMKVEDTGLRSWGILYKALKASNTAAFARAGISSREVPMLLVPSGETIRVLALHWPTRVYQDATSTPAEDIEVSETLVQHMVDYIEQEQNRVDEDFDPTKIEGKQLKQLNSMIESILRDDDVEDEEVETSENEDEIESLLKTMTSA